MAHASPSESARNQSISALEIFPPTRASHIVRGREISVYYSTQQEGSWARHRRKQVEIALFFNLSSCRIGWENAKGQWLEKEITGRQICLIPSEQIHECRLEGQAELLVLYVETELLRRTTGPKLTRVTLGDLARYDPEVWILATLLRRLCVAKVRAGERSIDAIGGELVQHVFKGAFSNESFATDQCACLTRTQYEKVTRYMQENLQRNIRVSELAGLIAHGERHFTHLFVNTTGKAPYHYLKELRISRAYDMLLTGDYLMREVAQALGYNADHFAKIFQQFCGFTTREFLVRIRSGQLKPPPQSVKPSDYPHFDEV